MPQSYYRPDIDGLRAVAILMVIGFHFFPDSIKGGFIGVDIFFVISGFLISSIIFRELDQGVFSFFTFYSRRIRRIFPALITILSSVLVLGWLSLLPDEYAQVGKHTAAGAGFVSNIVLWLESGYFDTVAITKPLLHLWSLSVEEQFYIIWPFFIWIAVKSRVNLLVLILVLAFLSFAYNLYAASVDRVWDFYAPFTRFWELLAGAVLAHRLYRSPFPSLYKSESQRIWRNTQPLLGCIVIFVGMFLITKDSTFPGYLAIIPVIGTMLIISANSLCWFNRVILSNRCMVWIGLISFPLYLWHWPLLSFSWIINAAEPSIVVRLYIIVISFILAWITFILIERPVRSGGQLYTKATILSLLLMIIAGLGLLTYKNNGFGFRTKSFEKITAAVGDRGTVDNVTKITVKEFEFLVVESPVEETTLILGDSNAAQYFPRVDYLQERSPSTTKRVILGASGGCPPIPNLIKDDRPLCFPMTSAALKLLQSDRSISTVVIAAAWPNYYTRPQFERYVKDKSGKSFIDFKNEGYVKALVNLELFIREIKAVDEKMKVALILSTPFGEPLNPKYMITRSLMNFPGILQPRSGGMSIKELENSYHYGDLKKDLIEVANKADVEFIDPINYLCDSSQCYAVDKNDEPIYFDAGHLRGSFARYQLNFLDKFFVVQ